MKKAIVLFLLCVTILSGCQAAAEPEPVLQPEEEPVAVEPQVDWAVLSEEEAYTKNTAILTGQVSDVRQEEISYTYLGAEVTDPITVFELEITKVLVCREGSCQPGDTVRVAMSGFGKAEEGGSYLLFCYGVADREDPMSLADYTDYWISAPKDLLIKQAGEYYLTTDWFAEVPGAEKLSETSEATDPNHRIDCGTLEMHIVNTAQTYNS